jgi:hypothetical protein
MANEFLRVINNLAEERDAGLDIINKHKLTS